MVTHTHIYVQFDSITTTMKQDFQDHVAKAIEASNDLGRAMMVGALTVCTTYTATTRQKDNPKSLTPIAQLLVICSPLVVVVVVVAQ